MTTWGLPAWLVRATVRLMVVALVTSSAAPLAHTFDRHELDGYEPMLVVHDASQHRIAADPHTIENADHCAACHLARAFSSSGLEVTAAPALSVGVHLTHASACVPIAQLDLRVPARAPPACA